MSQSLDFIGDYLAETKVILDEIDLYELSRLVSHIATLKRNNGRLFILGVGGSSGTASHAVNDFRKICRIETYTPTDNVSELTARTNDEGWENCFEQWLKGSNLTLLDSILILSVGGGSQEHNVSMNLVKAIDYAQTIGCDVLGIVGKNGGYTNQKADVCVIIPPLYSDKITPHTEGIASVLLHLIVSHPELKVEKTMWESIK